MVSSWLADSFFLAMSSCDNFFGAYVTSLNLNYLLKALSPNTDTLGVRASAYEFGGGHNSARSNTSEVDNGRDNPIYLGLES